MYTHTIIPTEEVQKLKYTIIPPLVIETNTFTQSNTVVRIFTE